MLPAPKGSPILQGKLSIEQAVRALEGILTLTHAGPAIRIIEGKNIEATGINNSLAPASFKPTLRVE